MEVRSLDQSTWEAFVREHAPVSGGFLHAWSYGDVERASGRTVYYLGCFREAELCAVALVSTRRVLRVFSYGSVLHGPLLRDGESLSDVCDALLLTVDVDFLRVEPTLNPGSGFIETRPMSPEHTLVLDLNRSPEELLAEMHKKTRYNIRVAERRGVEVRELQESEFDLAWKVFSETAERQSFRLHASKRYQDWIRHFPSARLMGAWIGDELAAVNLMIDFEGVRTYMHGASASAHRSSMAPYAIHWHQIQEAMNAGFTTYDFWGISDTKAAWKGITRFKRGFGGREIHYPGTFDYPRALWKYRLYSFLRRLR